MQRFFQQLRFNRRVIISLLVGLIFLLFTARTSISRLLSNVAMVDLLKSGLMESSSSQAALAHTVNVLETAGEIAPRGLSSEQKRILGNVYLWVGDSVTAVSYLNQASYSGNTLSDYDLGKWYLRQENYTQAAASLNKINPNTDTLVNYFIDQMLDQKDPIGALQLGKAYIAINPRASQTNYRLFNLYWSQGDRDQAVQALAQALQYDPDKTATYYIYNSARLSYLEKDFLQARDQIDPLLLSQADYFPAWLLKGQIELALNHPTEAQAALEKAVAINPNHVTARYNLGVAYQAQRQFTEAAANLRIAAQLDTVHTASLELLLQVYGQMGDTCRTDYLQPVLTLIQDGQSINLETKFAEMDQKCP